MPRCQVSRFQSPIQRTRPTVRELPSLNYQPYVRSCPSWYAAKYRQLWRLRHISLIFVAVFVQQLSTLEWLQLHGIVTGFAISRHFVLSWHRDTPTVTWYRHVWYHDTYRGIGGKVPHSSTWTTHRTSSYCASNRNNLHVDSWAATPHRLLPVSRWLVTPWSARRDEHQRNLIRDTPPITRSVVPIGSSKRIWQDKPGRG